MRRQFLRVYVGIALVLLLAALAILLVVDREVRRVVDHRLEETIEPWVWRMRQRLLRMEDPELRAQALERMDETLPFDVQLLKRSEAELPEEVREKLAAGESALVHRDQERLLYAPLDEEYLLVLGPLQGRLPPGRRWGRPPMRPPFEGGPGPPGRLPYQGTYLLLGTLFFILLLIGAAVYVLLRPFERRIYALADVARDFGQGQYDRRAADRGRDAIGSLARTFDDMAERTERFIERQKELLRAVSHEFRTPLARLFFLVDDAQATADAKEKDRHLKRIEGSLQELDELVGELLTFVRLEGSGEPMERERFAVAPVLADVAGVIGDLRPGVEIDIEAGEIEVRAVPRLFRRAVLNLATNAARHARQRLRLEGGRSEGGVLVVVEDDGSGIPAEARERVFEPFYRLDESRTADEGGAGLGLAIVQRIARLHGGRVEVGESALGGARFALFFPGA